MLIVFDLDFTLWDCGGTWCDCTNPPYKIKNDSVFDTLGRDIKLYRDVVKILDYLKDNNFKIAAASRTHEPTWANKLLKLLKVDHYFDYKEIYPGPKHPHFKSLKEKSGFDYSNMVFFDDEERNIRDISKLGVKSIYVKNGINYKLVLDNI